MHLKKVARDDGVSAERHVSGASPETAQGADDRFIPIASQPTTGNSASDSVRLKLDEYICNNSACESDPLYARSPEEAAWLFRNGYPSATDIANWQALSDEQLKKIADGGSLAAKSVYGERIALKGDMRGLDELLQAANSGSIYSYYGTSRVYAQKFNAVDGAAFLRVAYILGDVRASEAIMRNFPKMGSIDLYSVDKRASALYKTYARERKPSPRP